MRLVCLAAFIWFAADQFSKWAVVHWMRLDEIGHMTLWPPFLNFHMGWNTGLNFGLFAGQDEPVRWIFVSLAVGLSAWILWWAKTGLTRPIALIAAGLVVGGALGNALDRVIYGAVADFLNMSCCGITNPFAFNIADIGIFAGVLGLLFFTNDQKITP